MLLRKRRRESRPEANGSRKTGSRILDTGRVHGDASLASGEFRDSTGTASQLLPATEGTIALREPVVPEDRSWKRLLLDFIVSEPAMGVLSLVAFAASLGPLVFDVSPASQRALQAVEWSVVIVFMLNFVLRLSREPMKRKWLGRRGRILDLVTIGGPFLALLPGVSEAASGSLALRLLRVGRAVAFGTRAGGVATKGRDSDSARTGVPHLKVTRVSERPRLQCTEVSWKQCSDWAADPSPAWFHATQISLNEFREAASAAGLGEVDLEELYRPYGVARVRSSPDARSSILFLSVPTASDGVGTVVRRDRVAVVLNQRSLLSATPGSLDLPSMLDREEVPRQAFHVSVALRILGLAGDRLQYTARRLDRRIRELEPTGAIESDRRVLQVAPALRREISAVAFDSDQLQAVIGRLADGRRTLCGVNLEGDEYLTTLKDDFESLHERFKSLKEDVQSAIELDLNLKSFEMNRFLKLLAVVSCLGLIPAVIGGMLGMNVMGNPWPMTLGQVSFLAGMSGIVVLYVFAVKGWLR